MDIRLARPMLRCEAARRGRVSVGADVPFTLILSRPILSRPILSPILSRRRLI
jgi:hypothetical protein